MLRTVESYNEAVININVHETGIKQQCVLNRLTYFHAVTNFVQDVMHDIFEGVLAYDVPLICQCLITRGFFDISTLNHRIQTFDYGFADKANKPPVISSLNVDMLPFDAAQMWCMSRVLALAVGDKVPEDDNCWYFYLIMRDIVDIVMAPAVSDADLNALRVLVSEYLELHVLLFPNNSLKNKHHHLIHYESLIRRVGPLQRFSSMRFESKHQRCKKLLHISGNYKNVLKSCAYRHQHDVAFRLLDQQREMCSEVVVGTGSVITLSELSDGFEINKCLSNVGMCFELYDANWLEVKGVRYKPGCTLVAGLDADTCAPVFLNVEHIIVRDQFIWFIGEKHVGVAFISHYHAWSVERCSPREIICMHHTHITHHVPLIITKVLHCNEEVNMIALRHRV